MLDYLDMMNKLAVPWQTLTAHLDESIGEVYTEHDIMEIDDSQIEAAMHSNAAQLVRAQAQEDTKHEAQ